MPTPCPRNEKGTTPIFRTALRKGTLQGSKQMAVFFGKKPVIDKLALG